MINYKILYKFPLTWCPIFPPNQKFDHNIQLLSHPVKIRGSKFEIILKNAAYWELTGLKSVPSCKVGVGSAKKKRKKKKPDLAATSEWTRPHKFDTTRAISWTWINSPKVKPWGRWTVAIRFTNAGVHIPASMTISTPTTRVKLKPPKTPLTCVLDLIYTQEKYHVDKFRVPTLVVNYCYMWKTRWSQSHIVGSTILSFQLPAYKWRPELPNNWSYYKSSSLLAQYFSLRNLQITHSLFFS